MDLEKIIDKAIGLSSQGYPQDLEKVIKEMEDDDDNNKQ